jgi:hypothetical protein
MNTLKDKIVIDCNGDDNKALAEKLSRAEPGDKVEFSRMSATVDSYENGVATLSIEEIAVSGSGKKKVVEVEEAEEGSEPATESAAVSLFKGEAKAAKD